MRLPKDRLEALNLLEQIRKSILQSAEILIHPQPDWERRHLTPIGKPQTPAHSGKAAIHSKITLENLQVGGKETGISEARRQHGSETSGAVGNEGSRNEQDEQRYGNQSSSKPVDKPPGL